MLERKLPSSVRPDNMGDIENSSALDSVSFGYIRENLLGYVAFHLYKTIPFFLASGARVFFIGYNDLSGQTIFSFSKSNMTNLLLRGQFFNFFSALKDNFVVFAEETAWFLITVFSLLALFSKKHRLWTIFFLASIAYFAVLTGPIAYARFRLPASPFLFLLASFGVTVAWRAGHNFFSPKPTASEGI